MKSTTRKRDGTKRKARPTEDTAKHAGMTDTEHAHQLLSRIPTNSTRHQAKDTTQKALPNVLGNER